MKKAWEIFKKTGIRTMEAWRTALRQAWAIVKGVLKMAKMQVVSYENVKKAACKQLPFVEIIRSASCIRVTNSYEVKDQLKSAGAKFYRGFDATGWEFRFQTLEEMFSTLASLSKMFDSVFAIDAYQFNFDRIVAELEKAGASIEIVK